MPDGQNTCPQDRTIPPGAVELFSVDFQDSLDSGITLTGTPSVTEVNEDDVAAGSGADLTINNVAVSTAALTINDRSVAIGLAVQFLVQGRNLVRHDVPHNVIVNAEIAVDETVAHPGHGAPGNRWVAGAKGLRDVPGGFA